MTLPQLREELSQLEQEAAELTQWGAAASMLSERMNRVRARIRAAEAKEVPFDRNEMIEAGQRIMDRSGNVFEVLDWRSPQNTHTQALQGDVLLEFISGPRENRHPGPARWVSAKIVREYSVKVAA